MTDPAAPLARPQTYASPLMQERRHRILVEARALLAEGGQTGFSIRELSRRAAVSSRTLYATFGGKDGILSAAVAEHVQQFGEHLAHGSRGADLPAVFAEFQAVVEEVRRTPAYTRTLIELYYSLAPLEPALEMIRELPSNRLRRWLDQAPAGAVPPGLDRAWVIEQHVDSELAIFHHWAVGRIDLDGLGAALRRNFMASLLKVTCGPFRDELLREVLSV